MQGFDWMLLLVVVKTVALELGKDNGNHIEAQ